MPHSNHPENNPSVPHIPINAKRLRQARQAKELSLEEVSQRVSINKMTLLRYETGDIRTIAPERLYRLAELYGTTPAHLYGISPSQEYSTEDGLQIIPISADAPSHIGKRLQACLRLMNGHQEELPR